MDRFASFRLVSPSRFAAVVIAVVAVALVGNRSPAVAQRLDLKTYQPSDPFATPPPLSAASPAPKTAPATAPSAATPTPSGYQPPKLIQRAPISYPDMAHLNRVEGVVKVKMFIDEQGRVTNAIVSATSGSMMLDQVVLDPRMKEWTFQPATLDGKPVPSAKEQEFEFRLDPAEEKAMALKRMARPLGTPDPPYPPEALAHDKPQGKTTFGVYWTQGPQGGLVDKVYLIKSSGSGLLDRFAMRYAYENWRVDPSKATKEAFVKTVNFVPPK